MASRFRHFGCDSPIFSVELYENSDIDFIVEFNKASYDSLFNLKNFLENLFTKRVDIIRLRPSIKKRSLDLIKKDMINV